MFEQFAHGRKIKPFPGGAEGFSKDILAPDILQLKSCFRSMG
jgi:hypothetical protein